MTTTGKIVGVNGNMITVAFSGAVAQNEVGYAICGGKKLMAEIVRVRGTRCDMQVFDSTTDLMVDDNVEFTGELTPVASPLSAAAAFTYAIRLSISIRRTALGTDAGNEVFNRLTAASAPESAG